MNEFSNNPDTWKNLCGHIIAHSICEYATMVKIGMAKSGTAMPNMKIPKSMSSRNILGGITTIGDAHDCINFLFKPSIAADAIWDFCGLSQPAVAALLKCPIHLKRLKHSNINTKLSVRENKTLCP